MKRNDDDLFFYGISLLLLIGIIVFFLMSLARADDPSVHGNPGHDWYQNAETTPRSRDRFGGLVKCCAMSEVVRTQFRVDRSSAEDTWWYLDKPSNQWRQIPEDIIHWGERAPDNQPTLFIWNGQPTCFFPPEEGI